MSAGAITEALTSADPMRRALGDLFYTYSSLSPDRHVAASADTPTFCAGCEMPWPCPAERALRVLSGPVPPAAPLPVEEASDGE